MANSCLTSLAPDVLVEILSFITHNSIQLAWFTSLCRAVCTTLHQDEAWRHLCYRYWRATEDRMKEWPALSSHGLYRALEQWAPMEGFYVLTPAFPWGMLVLVRITDGCVVANVIRFVPLETGQFLEVPVPLFRVAIHEERLGVVRSVLDAPWLGGHTAQLSNLEPQHLCARTEVAAHFSSCMIHEARLFTARRALRVSIESNAGDSAAMVTMEGTTTPSSDGCERESTPALSTLQSGTDAQSTGRSKQLGREWQPGRLFGTAEQALGQTNAMLQHMLGDLAIPCDLALIRSPRDFSPLDSSFPGVRPGLYVGDYGHEFYGQFRTEVLLVEYATLTCQDLAEEMQDPRRIFTRPNGEQAPLQLSALAELSGPFTFMRIVKQCGDCHVPMGATTFVAICGPPEACAALADPEGAPQVIENRQARQMESVLRVWRGFGTLAMGGFHDPNWDGGWLIRLVDDGACGEQRFGFVFDRDLAGHKQSVVLRWVMAQDTSPFLQRAWLPEDLQ